MRAKRETIEKIDYTIDEPIAIIFDAVKDLVEIVELAGRPYSACQIVDIEYIFLSKLRIFRSDIRKWIRRLEEEKPRPNLVLVFIEVHQELRDIDTTVDELGFHTANAIVSQIMNQLRKKYTPPADKTKHTEVCIPITEAPPPSPAADYITPYTETLTAPVTNAIQ